MNYSPPGSSVHGDSPGKNASGLLCPPPGDLPKPGIEPRSPTLQADSLPAEPQGNTQNSSSLVNQELPDVEAEFRKAEEQRSNCQHSLDHRGSKRIPEKLLFH